MNAPAMTVQRLKDLVSVATLPEPPNVAGLGSLIEVEDVKTRTRRTYRLVDPAEANPADGRLSMDCPVGLVLRGRQAGEVVTATTPRGHRRLRVLHVE
jgi:transcription elongation factor GreA